MIGNKYNHLTVLSHNHTDIKGESYWFCKCNCGRHRIVRERYLLTNYVKSCGCVLIDTSKAMTKKGVYMETGRNVTKEYHTWHSMKARCYRKTESRYHTHGARGITVCDKWRYSYSAFLTDVGRAPTLKHSLDRIDNNGNYEPGNVRWATYIQQANNKRNNKILELNGIKDTLPNWCRKLGLDSSRVHDRLSRGWSVEDALNRELYRITSGTKRKRPHLLEKQLPATTT